MKDKRILGLDLGSGALKLVLMEWLGGGPVVTQMRLLEFPPASDGKIRAAALKQLLQGIPLGGTAQIVSVVDDPFACVHPVAVPPMPAGELAGAARWELQRHLAVPLEEAMVDYELAGEIESAGTRKLKLLAVGLPREAVQRHLSFLSEAGIKPTQLFPKACAIAAWTRRTAPAEKGPVALLVIGADSSEFIVAQEGQPLFTRKIPVSGNDFTKGMTGTLVTGQGQTALTETEAETIKRSVGIPQGPSAESGAKGISETQLLALLRGNLDRLAAEVERSIVFCGESLGGVNIQELILIGGGAHLNGLAGWLKERLKIRVSVPDPLKEFRKEPLALQGPAGAMPLSFVPALGAVSNAGKGINLLPAEMKRAIQTRLQRAALTGVLTAVIVGASFVRIGLGIYEKTLQGQMAAFRLEQSALAPQLAKARAAAVIQGEQNRQPLWEDLFKELSQVVPREITLTGLTIQGAEAALRGRVRESDRPADQILADFQRILGEGLFTQVRLASSRQMEEPVKEAEFEIRCLLR